MKWVDALGHSVELTDNPKRIVSLVPSQTELLCDLGLADQLVGATRFCVHPKSIRQTATIVGGTKDATLDRIAALSPDLVLCNKEENTKALVEELQHSFPTYTTDVTTLESAMNMIKSVGQICGVDHTGEALRKKIQQEFDKLSPISAQKKALYLIWKDPYMSVGQGTFLHEMLETLGVENILADTQRYPTISLDNLNETPDIVFLSSEPYPFKEKHIEVIQNHFPECKVVLVDGELFSWYGSRLLRTPTYFNHLREQYSLG